MSTPPGRPDHPDFWLISEALIELDTQADQGASFEDIVGRLVDPESVLYAAVQRAIWRKNIGGGSSISLWMDGFVTGVRYQHKRQESDHKGDSNG